MTGASPHLVVLGVAQDGGRPQTGCRRPCCEPAWQQGHRDRISCLGLIDGELRFLLDCTPDLPSQLHDLGGPPLHGVVLTHAHLGHYTGLLQLGPEAWGARGIPVHAMPAMTAFLREHAPWCALETGGHIVMQPLQADVRVPLTEKVAIVPWLVPHRGPWSETIGVVVEGPRRKALYLPDLDRWEDWERDPVQVVRELDRIWCDGTFFSAEEVGWRDRSQILHPLVQDSLQRLSVLPEDQRHKVCFIHLNHTNPLLDERSAAYRQVTELGFQIAREGDVFEL
jgi:pyrroloquinoline quinone biosynthesis protein B